MQKVLGLWTLEAVARKPNCPTNGSAREREAHLSDFRNARDSASKTAYRLQCVVGADKAAVSLRENNFRSSKTNTAVTY